MQDDPDALADAIIEVFREISKSDRAQLRKAIAVLDAGDVLMVTRLDQLARLTLDLLNRTQGPDGL